MMCIRAFCAALLLLQGPADFAHAQQPSPAPSQSTSPPPAEEKQRTAKETHKELEDLACGPPHVRLVHHTEDGQQTLPQQPPEKALIYVIRTRNILGSASQANFAMDGKWVGASRIGNYFYLEADPGPHYFCLKFWGSHPGLLSLVTEKGKTYYLRETITMAGGIEIDLIDETEGKGDVAKYHRSSFEVKQKK